MTSRERVARALRHEQPDRAPIDFGATPVTGIAASAVHALRRRLGLAETPIRVTDPYQMLGAIDPDLAACLSIDVVGMTPRVNLFGFPNDRWKEWRLFDDTPVLVPGLFNTIADHDGSIPMYPQGDTSAAPSARMPRGGFYFDSIRRQHPIYEDRLDPADNLEEITLLDDETLRSVESESRLLFEGTDYAIVGSAGTSALGDIALVPAPMLKDPKGIRDVEEWYVSTMTRRDYLKEVFDRQTLLAVRNFELYRQAVGDRISALYLCGTDFGTQLAPFCSDEVFRDLYLPFYRRMTDWIHGHTGWKVFKHSCGAIEPLIPSFIEAGFDILNPVQCAAAGMEPRVLKEKYGDRVVFWGGGVDTQTVLQFGSPEEVRAQVVERLRVLGRGGGFVFSTVHNVLAGVPVENLMAVIETVKGGTRWA